MQVQSSVPSIYSHSPRETPESSFRSKNSLSDVSTAVFIDFLTTKTWQHCFRQKSMAAILTKKKQLTLTVKLDAVRF